MAATPTIDARPASADLLLYAGDDVTLHIEVKTQADVPYDLTGYTAQAQIRETVDAATSVDFDATVLANTIDLTLTTADTTTLPAKGFWDCQITSATGAVTTLVAGKVTVTSGVTR